MRSPSRTAYFSRWDRHQGDDGLSHVCFVVVPHIIDLGFGHDDLFPLAHYPGAASQCSAVSGF